MSLESDFNSKLNSLKNYLERAYESCHNLNKLIQDFITREIIDDELIRTFAIKENELPIFQSRLKELNTIYSMFKNNKDIICLKNETMNNGLKLLAKLEDEFSVFVSEIKAITIFLENKMR